MQRRTQAIILIVGGFLILLGILLWLFWPLLNKPAAVQPPALPTNVQPSTGKPTNQGSPQTQRTPSTAPAPILAPNEQQAEDGAKQFASDFTSRMATYSSTDGFSAITQVYTQVTPDVKTYLESERTKLIAAHPAYGTSWGQTTRAIATRLITATPILQKTQIEIVVQAQQFTTVGGIQSGSASYQEADLVLNRQGSTWIVSHITWQPFQP